MRGGKLVPTINSRITRFYVSYPQRKPEIIVATPGRLWELMKIEDHLDAISHCDMLVIDETDRMIERGHFEELSSIIHHMNKVRGNNVDNLMT